MFHEIIDLTINEYNPFIFGPKQRLQILIKKFMIFSFSSVFLIPETYIINYRAEILHCNTDYLKLILLINNISC